MNYYPASCTSSNYAHVIQMLALASGHIVDGASSTEDSREYFRVLVADGTYQTEYQLEVILRALATEIPVGVPDDDLSETLYHMALEDLEEIDGTAYSAVEGETSAMGTLMKLEDHFFGTN